MNNKDLLNDLDNLFNQVTKVKLKYDIINASNQFNDLLSQLEKDNLSYDIWLGYYGLEDFVIDRVLNNNDINAWMDIKGDDGIDYLIQYHKDNNTRFYMPSQPTVAIQIRVDNDSMDTYYIEYDGYTLEYDLG